MTPNPRSCRSSNEQVALDRASTANLQVNGVNGYTWNGTLDGSIAPTIDSITTRVGRRRAGTFPSELFGIAPIARDGRRDDRQLQRPGVPVGP